MRSKVLILVAVFAALAVAAAPASAYWNGSNDQRHGQSAGEAGTVGQGTVPTLVKLSASRFKVTWTATTLSNGQAASGYVVSRVKQGTTTVVPAANGCEGLISGALTCTESGVPSGIWQYTVAPRVGTNWSGAESAKSAAVTSEAGTLALSSTLIGGTVRPLPATLTGTLAGFGPEEGIASYVLDASTPLTGTPSKVNAEGKANITSLVIPTGASDGTHTVRIVGALGSEAVRTITVDNTAPSGGSVDATGLTGTGGRYSAQTSLSVALSRGTDPGAGLATGHQLLRASAPLTSNGTTDGVCGSFGNFAQVGELNPAETVSDPGLTDKSCYRYKYVVPDVLGNKATYQSPDIKVDATPPPAATLSFTASGNAFWPGTGTTVFFRPGATSGSFKVTASANDLFSGIATFTFPSLGSGWTTTPEGGNAATFSWSAANPAAPGAKNITDTNNAGLSANKAFTTTADSTGPTGGSVTYTNGTIGTSSVSVTFAKGTDAGAGVESGSGILQRATAPLTGSTCGTFGSFATIQANPTTPFNDSTIEDGKCFKYQYLISDNVGNQSVFTSTNVLKVQIPPANTSAPTIAGSAQEGSQLTANDGNWTGTGNVFTYQWRRCNSTGASCSDIAGATAKTYTAALADVGNTIRVVVTATNTAGSVSATSGQTAVVLDAKPANTVSPQISGSPQVGQPLTVDDGTWTGGNLAFSYQWLRCDTTGGACVKIAVSLTTKTYTIEKIDVGSTIRVDVTATNSGGSTTTRTAPTAEVGSKAPFNLTLPVISGLIREGQSLNTTNGTWTNTGGTLNFSYQWRRCDTSGSNCVNVGTNAATYILQTADVEHRMRVIVTAQDTQGTTKAESVQTAIVAFAPAVNTVAPVISGEPEVGKTFTATTGTWTGGGITFSFRWQSCQGNGTNCNNISGSAAEQSSYTLVDSDGERSVRVIVTATNSGGAVKKESSTSEAIKRVAPVNTGAPQVTGVAQHGQVLSTTDGTWTGSGLTFKYHWLRCDTAGANCVKIAGTSAEKVNYAVTATDVGSTLRSEVTASNFGHTVPGPLSAPTAVVVPPTPTNTLAPVIPGVPKQGVPVTTTNGSWTGSPTFTYQWSRCVETTCTTIAGATGQSYVPVAADVGKSLSVVVTGTNAGGSASATSGFSAVVVPPAPVNTAPPTISGTRKVGQVFTANEGTWTNNPTFTYVWKRCDAGGNNCGAIPGATSKTYTLSAEDALHKMRLDVTGTNGGGSAVAITEVTEPIAP